MVETVQGLDGGAGELELLAGGAVESVDGGLVGAGIRRRVTVMPFDSRWSIL